MNNLKPEIYIYAQEYDLRDLKEIIAGLEEEGVLYRVFEMEEIMNVKELAHKASVNSPLDTGIGLCRKSICLNNSKLSADEPIFQYQDCDRLLLRNIGHNAARLIKVSSLKI